MLLLAVRHRAPATAATAAATASTASTAAATSAAAAATAAAAARCQSHCQPAAISFACSSRTLCTTSVAAASSFSSSAAATRRHITEDKQRRVPDSLGTVLVRREGAREQRWRQRRRGGRGVCSRRRMRAFA